jgi:hypothetical protein
VTREEFDETVSRIWRKINQMDAKMDDFLAKQYAKLPGEANEDDMHNIAVACAKTFDPLLLRLVIAVAKLLANFNVKFGLELLICPETGSVGWAPESDPLNLIGVQNDPEFQAMYADLIEVLSASCIGVALGPQVAELLQNYANAQDGEVDGHDSN